MKLSEIEATIPTEDLLYIIKECKAIRVVLLDEDWNKFNK